MLKNNGVLIVSLAALVLAVAMALVWLRGRHEGPIAASSAAPAALSAAAAGAPASSPEVQPPAPPPPPAGEAPVDQQAALASALPTEVGQCAATTVKDVSTRLDIPDSGSAINFTNGGYQVSYDTVPEIEASRAGDAVRMCLVALPQDCPPGDVRGIVYKATNQRTGQSWTLPDSEHACGGA